MLELIHTYAMHYLWSDGYQLTGLTITLWLFVISSIGGALLALPLAIARVSANVYCSAPVWLFTTLLRGTPLYVQLLVIYSGFASLSLIRDSLTLWSFFREGINCAITALTLNHCAYCTEVFAGSIRTTPHGELEAARAIGLSTVRLYRRIILPSALRRAWTAYSNDLLHLIHMTSLAFSITVPDLLYVASYVNATTFRTFEAYGIVAVLYLLITLGLVQLFKRIERRYLAHLRPPGHPSPTPR
jgi:histidine transport system permease protein